MKPPSSHSRPVPFVPAAIFALFAAGSLLAQTPSPTPPAPTAAADVVVELSPFTVNSAADKGYRAENTLAGSRLNTSLRDTPASISVFTREFLDDIGLNEIPRRERRGDAARADRGG